MDASDDRHAALLRVREARALAGEVDRRERWTIIAKWTKANRVSRRFAIERFSERGRPRLNV